MFYGNMSSVGPVEALVSLVMRFVPSIAKMASESRHSEASKAILSLQWIFLPVYVGGLLYLQPPWSGLPPIQRTLPIDGKMGLGVSSGKDETAVQRGV